MSKPKLKYNSVTEQWECFGRGRAQWGNTPNQAYIRWRVLTDMYKHCFDHKYEKYNNRLLMV